MHLRNEEHEIDRPGEWAPQTVCQVQPGAERSLDQVGRHEQRAAHLVGMPLEAARCPVGAQRHDRRVAPLEELHQLVPVTGDQRPVRRIAHDLVRADDVVGVRGASGRDRLV